MMPSLFPIEECDMNRLYEIEQAAHLVPWSLGTLKNNVGERYLNLKLVEKEQVLGFAICQMVLDEATLFNIAIYQFIICKVTFIFHNTGTEQHYKQIFRPVK